MVKASGLGLDVLMVDTTEYHEPQRLAVHAAIAGSVSVLACAAAVREFDLSIWAFSGALGPLVVALLMAEPTRREAPSGNWSPAHRVTLLRAALVGVVACACWTDGNAVDPRWVVAVATTAFALDGVDGWLARRTNTASAYGARLDMELDAAFVVVLAALAWTWDRAGGWVIFCGAARYLWWVAEHAIPWFRQPLFPSSHRRHGCFIAVTALLLCLWPWPQDTWSVYLAGAATGTLTLSFGIDAVWLFRHRGGRP